MKTEREALIEAEAALARLAARDGWRLTPKECGDGDEWQSAESQGLYALAACRLALGRDLFPWPGVQL